MHDNQGDAPKEHRGGEDDVDGGRRPRGVGEGGRMEGIIIRPSRHSAGGDQQRSRPMRGHVDEDDEDHDDGDSGEGDSSLYGGNQVEDHMRTLMKKIMVGDMTTEEGVVETMGPGVACLRKLSAEFGAGTMFGTLRPNSKIAEVGRTMGALMQVMEERVAGLSSEDDLKACVRGLTWIMESFGNLNAKVKDAKSAKVTEDERMGEVVRGTPYTQACVVQVVTRLVTTLQTTGTRHKGRRRGPYSFPECPDLAVIAGGRATHFLVADAVAGNARMDQVFNTYPNQVGGGARLGRRRGQRVPANPSSGTGLTTLQQEHADRGGILDQKDLEGNDDTEDPKGDGDDTSAIETSDVDNDESDYYTKWRNDEDANDGDDGAEGEDTGVGGDGAIGEDTDAEGDGAIGEDTDAENDVAIGEDTDAEGDGAIGEYTDADGEGDDTDVGDEGVEGEDTDAGDEGVSLPDKIVRLEIELKEARRQMAEGTACEAMCKIADLGAGGGIIDSWDLNSIETIEEAAEKGLWLSRCGGCDRLMVWEMETSKFTSLFEAERDCQNCGTTCAAPVPKRGTCCESVCWLCCGMCAGPKPRKGEACGALCTVCDQACRDEKCRVCDDTRRHRPERCHDVGTQRFDGIYCGDCRMGILICDDGCNRRHCGSCGEVGCCDEGCRRRVTMHEATRSCHCCYEHSEFCGGGGLRGGPDPCCFGKAEYDGRCTARETESERMVRIVGAMKQYAAGPAREGDDSTFDSTYSYLMRGLFDMMVEVSEEEAEVKWNLLRGLWKEEPPDSTTDIDAEYLIVKSTVTIPEDKEYWAGMASRMMRGVRASRTASENGRGEVEGETTKHIQDLEAELEEAKRWEAEEEAIRVLGDKVVAMQAKMDALKAADDIAPVQNAVGKGRTLRLVELTTGEGPPNEGW